MIDSGYAYRGYWIHRYVLGRLWWIERKGAFVAYATDRTDAMRIIDRRIDG